MKKYVPHQSTRYRNKADVDKRRSTLESAANRKQLPELYENRENCCGCSACYSICPAQAISMEPDEEGFLYPVVDAKLCVRCYQCLKVCAFKADQIRKGYLTSG